MPMKLIIFEDERYDNLYPLTYMRPVFELRCGATSLAEKIRHAAGASSATYFVRDWLCAAYAERTDEPVNDIAELDGDLLLVNGRFLADGKFDLKALGSNQFLKADGTIVAAKVRAGTLAAAKESAVKQAGQVGQIGPSGSSFFAATLAALEAKLAQAHGAATMIDYPWSLIYHNAAMIKSDFERLYKPGVHAPMPPLSCIIGDESSVYIAPTAKINPLVAIDVTGGPVIIEEKVLVLPHTRIDGPSYIGPECRIMGGKIREACSLGPVCRVAGELECTIMQGYANKQHDGFLGHSYVCEWVNLGALTTNSDLKNDYTPVSVYYKGELRDTGEQFLGSMIGDHTKTSIGIILNTGSVIGMMSNLVFSGQLMPKYVPSFCWMLNDRPTKGMGLKAMLDTARASMARRKKEMSAAEEQLIQHLHGMLKGELHAAIKKAFKGART